MASKRQRKKTGAKTGKGKGGRHVSIQWNADYAIKAVTRATQQSTKDLMEEVKERAVEYAPERTGDLKKSARVQYGKSRTMVYFDATYALVQHEDLDFYHKVGGPKYLERAFNEIMPHLRPEMSRKLKAALKRTGTRE